MSYQVIARKWRPQLFEDVTGQEHVTQTLRNAIEHGRLHHAYLFSGARGVGKTTTARLLAKALNCKKTDGPNIRPCAFDDADACVSCKEIAESRSIDVMEFDAASHTGVDDIRDLILQSINVSTARDRYKIFIIDEVHMLSKSSFNALLKTLEEPPPFVVFIMATTEPHKLPDTILSRCQEFEFRTIPTVKIADRLTLIAKAENIEISDDAIRAIARSGEGSMRDAQSNFDQVISFSTGAITAADVISALGIASTEMLTNVLRAVETNDPKLMFSVVGNLVSRGHDLRNFCLDLLSLFRDLLVYKIAGTAEGLLENSILTPEEIEKHAAPFSESDLLRFFNSVSETESALKEAARSQHMLEVGLVKLVEMRRLASIESILEKFKNITPENFSNAAAAETSDTTEKKTLKSEPPTKSPEPSSVEPTETEKRDPEPKPESIPDEAPFDIEEPPDVEIQVPAEQFRPKRTEQRTSSIDLSFVESIPVRLPDIDSEYLQHVDDPWLDNAYEERLENTGDDLMPIASASKLTEMLFGKRETAAQPANGNSAAAAVRARTVEDIAPAFDEDDDAPLPVLSGEPTKEELMKYANAHPTVKAALRIFRAELIDVRKR
jgi:DNA polymerase-3 subunit gamma/tau